MNYSTKTEEIKILLKNVEEQNESKIYKRPLFLIYSINMAEI
jgi:hypothetical protein